MTHLFTHFSGITITGSGSDDKASASPSCPSPPASTPGSAHSCIQWKVPSLSSGGQQDQCYQNVHVQIIYSLWELESLMEPSICLSWKTESLGLGVLWAVVCPKIAAECIRS